MEHTPLHYDLFLLIKNENEAEIKSFQGKMLAGKFIGSLHYFITSSENYSKPVINDFIIIRSS